MSRIDYYDDPDAPPANSLVPAASAIVIDNQQRVLLHKRADNSLWSLPGGTMEIGESLSHTVVREVQEETGLVVRPDYIIAVYSDPKHVFKYSDGEVRQEFSICVACSYVNGSLTMSEESTDIGFYSRFQIQDLAMHPRIQARIDDYFAGVRAGFNPVGLDLFLL